MEKKKMLQNKQKKFIKRALVTGHLQRTHLNQSRYDASTLRTHAELLNYAFPLYAGRSYDLKAITQLRYKCPSLRSEIFKKMENLTLDGNSGDNNMKSNFEIHFWDLSDRVRYNLDLKFLEKLFDKASKGNSKKLANKIGISYPYISPLKRGVYSIPTNLLIKIAKIAKIDLLTIEKNITSMRTRHGILCRMKLPIKPSEEMASLVGHVFGDGYIGSVKRHFEYCNDNKNLMTEVKEHVRKVFGLKPMTERTNRVGYSTIVGEILEIFGAHLAPKIQSEKEIPKWIKVGPVEYKKAFVKALFDDDGSVMYSEKYKAKGVNFYQIRHKSKLENSHRHLSEIKEILEEFNVYSGIPHLRKIYTSNNEEHAISYINITDYVSIVNFYNNIGLAEGNKLTKLRKIIAKKPAYTKKRLEVNM